MKAKKPRPPVLPYNTILCAVDFSPASTKALSYALSLAQEAAATLVLLHVTQWPTPQQIGSDSSLAAAALADSVRHEAEHKLREAVPAAAREWCEARELVTSGRPHEDIVETAAQEHADLIVMGVHSRAAALTTFFGSTANQVVRHARCPVLVVRP